MGVKPETIDRLLLSRSLIAPLRFNRANDRFAVASHVLAAHDAAELAISAVCSECQVPGISDARAPWLPEYLFKLRDARHPGRDVVAQDYINKLNRVRVDLKHHGIIPDVQQWGEVAEKVFGHISTWCQEYLQIDYAQLDTAELIRSLTVRDTMRAARQHLQQGNFRECLETLAQAVSESGLELLPIGLHVPVGVANAETALQLSAYGIDPGRYLALQRLLPRSTQYAGFKPFWLERKYGHKGNWTQEKAEFAYSETVDLLVRLQNANPYPTPYLYEDVFRDVLIVKNEAPDVRILKWEFDEGWTVSPEQVTFAVGDRIECRAFGSILALSEIYDPEKGCDFAPEGAPRVVAREIQNCTRLASIGGGPSLAVVFEEKDVEITSEPWDSLAEP